MIGNDIVSLAIVLKNPKANNKRFVNFILTEKEKAQWQTFEDKEKWLWVFWALKESAYKLEYKSLLYRHFAPKKFECTIENIDTVFIKTPLTTYNGKVKITANYIHAICSDTISSNTYFQIDKLSDSTRNTQSSEVRKHLKNYLAQKYQFSIEQISIKKENNIPILVIPNTTFLNFDISLSHHGTFSAFAIHEIE